MLYVIGIVTIILSYFIGSISSSVLISKKINGTDIRKSGSGNAGATNMLRVHGKAAGAVTLLCDSLKGVVAVLVSVLVDWLILKYFKSTETVFGNIFLGNLKYIAGVFVVLGHDFPIFFKFKGGKGIATSLGVMLALNWQIGLIVAIFSILIMLISGYVSLGSIIGGIIYPIAVIAFSAGRNEFNIIYIICSLIMGIIAISKHHSNIKRLINGTENKLFSKKKG